MICSYDTCIKLATEFYYMKAKGTPNRYRLYHVCKQCLKELKKENEIRISDKKLR